MHQKLLLDKISSVFKSLLNTKDKSETPEKPKTKPTNKPETAMMTNE